MAIENPFGKAVTIQESNPLANAEAEKAIQEVQAAMVIAKRFPRNRIRCMDNILNACTRPTLAMSAVYSYPRGGEEVSGPSIRLAEAIAQEWGNIQFGLRELSQSNGVSTVQAFAWDIESNTKQEKTFHVEHKRSTRKGVKVLTDQRDIYELVANQGARRMRSCILSVIPGDVTEQAVKACETTQAQSFEVTPEVIKDYLSQLEKIGAHRELVEKRFGKRAESFNSQQIMQLNKILLSVRDRMTKPSDWFDIEESIEDEKPKVSSIKVTPKKTEVVQEEPTKAVDPETGELFEKQQAAEQPKVEEKKPAFPPQLLELRKRLENVDSEQEANALYELSLFKKMAAKWRQEFTNEVDDHLTKLGI